LFNGNLFDSASMSSALVMSNLQRYCHRKFAAARSRPNI
jgi:hypothetical protein